MTTDTTARLDTDDQRERAIINAVYRALRRAEWGPRNTRDLDNYGNDPGHKTIGSGTIPNASRRDAIHTTMTRLAVIGTTETTPTLTVILTEPAYQRTLDALTREEHLAHQRSLTGKHPPPYRRTTDRWGSAYWRATEYGWSWTAVKELADGPVFYSARHARTALAKIAAACRIVRAEHSS